MKATINDFFNENPNCSKFTGNTHAISVFDLLSKDDNIISMIDACESRKPALAPCVTELESFYDSLNAPQIDFTDGFTRTAVGRMVKTILKPFGYEVTVQKDLPKAYKGKYFTSASCYSKTGTATMQVTRTISEIKE
jgi:hypothetical protein